jgi:hypothetical protein
MLDMSCMYKLYEVYIVYTPHINCGNYTIQYTHIYHEKLKFIRNYIQIVHNWNCSYLRKIQTNVKL